MNIFCADKNRCKGCGYCVDVCPVNILKLTDKDNDYGNKYVKCIDSDKCIGCNMCSTVCPDWAIVIRSKKDAKSLIAR